MSNLASGLSIMIMGLVITFSALAIFIGLILLLKRFFPPQTNHKAEDKPEEKQIVSLMKRDTTEEEIAAAITIALAHLYSQDVGRSELGAALENGPGPWWVGGRLEQYPLSSLSIQRRN